VEDSKDSLEELLRTVNVAEVTAATTGRGKRGGQEAVATDRASAALQAADATVVDEATGQVDSCRKATLPAASGRKKAADPQVADLVVKFKDVFNEDVKPMEGPEMTIKLKSDARPKRILTARPCPAHLQRGASEILVPKAMPGKARLVTDYMWLNRLWTGQSTLSRRLWMSSSPSTPRAQSSPN
jgi:hypothetical protein